MKIPITPPTLGDFLRELTDTKILAKIFAERFGPTLNGKYLHWDRLRHRSPPDGFTSEEWWAGIKISRSQNRREISLLDRNQQPFQYSTPDTVLKILHEIDRDASGHLAVPEPISNPQTKDRYLQSSLIEEAITSSQLEGAAATREQAKEMIRFGRKPVDRSERMILNNYRAMQLIGSLKNRPLTYELVYEIHGIITTGTLPENSTPPYLRQEDDGIAVWDNRDNRLLHQPPPASEILDRMKAMCEFANGAETGVFLHPVVKAIILHFWLAYDHPFIDGNRRTARALFYWSMLSQGYWLIEYISISSILRKAPAKYARSFLYTETDENDLTYFIDAQLGVMRQAITELHEYLAKKIAEIKKTEQLLRASAELNHRQLALLGHALRNIGTRYTIESHRMSHAVTYQTARTDLLDLAAKGLLLKTRSGRTFVFNPVQNLYDRLRQLF